MSKDMFVLKLDRSEFNTVSDAVEQLHMRLTRAASALDPKYHSEELARDLMDLQAILYKIEQVVMDEVLPNETT
jgi:hypothetical protein